MYLDEVKAALSTIDVKHRLQVWNSGNGLFITGHISDNVSTCPLFILDNTIIAISPPPFADPMWDALWDKALHMTNRFVRIHNAKLGFNKELQ